MSNVILDSTTATAVVTMVKNQIKNEAGKYAAYVESNGVTVDNVAEHVKALREQAYPGVKADGRAEQGTPERDAKKFADKVRLGLRSAIGDSPEARKSEDTDWIKKITTDVTKAVEAGLGTSDITKAVTAALNAVLA